MKKFLIFILAVIVVVWGYKKVRNYINTDYGCSSSITYSAGSSSEWAYGNQRKEFDAGSTCYARIGEVIYAEKKYNIENEINVTYRFTINGDCSIDLSEGKAEKVDTNDENVVEYTRKLKAQDPSKIAEDVAVFRYVSKGEGSIKLEIKYGRRIKKEFDTQSTIYFVKQ